MTRDDLIKHYRSLTKKGDNKFQVLTINARRLTVKMIDLLVSKGVFCSRSEAVRQCLSRLLPVLYNEATQQEELVRDLELENDMIRIPKGNGEFKEVKIIRRLE